MIDSLKNANIKIWKGMLDEGVSTEHISKMAKQHIAALEALPDHIEGKEQALKECKTYLQEIELNTNHEN